MNTRAEAPKWPAARACAAASPEADHTCDLDCDYEVACPARTRIPTQGLSRGDQFAWSGTGRRVTAVSIDYSRSQWRMGWDPLAGRNRTDGLVHE